MIICVSAVPEPPVSRIIGVGAGQAGTSGGGFDYDVPLPEAPSPAGNGPDLSLQYDASSVDGQGRWTNNQSGVVGVGWDLNAGFIERRYRRCFVDNWYTETGELTWLADERGIGGRALCWESPDQNDNDAATHDQTQSELVLSAGGRSALIVRDRTSGAWKTVPDLGWKIEQVAGGADGQPYWKVTDQGGRVWRFGHNRDAQWQTPYIGNEHDEFGVADEPCFARYYYDELPPTCTGVWRWNLDQEIDRNENVIDYSYTRETNYFCLPSCGHEAYRVLPYDRGGFLSEVVWGHNTQVAGSEPTSRTVFTTVARDGDDVPTDLHCDQAVGCTNDAIAFYSTRKLTAVRAESRNPGTGEWDPVDRLDLTHDWIYQRTDFGFAYDPVMWLDTVQQTGMAAEPEVLLPPLDFGAVMLAGKMDYDTLSDWTDQLSWRMVPRIAAIANGMGGRIEVTYSQPSPCGGGKGRVGGDYLSDKTGDCYQLDMGSDPEQGYETWSRFFKQLATKVVERDMVAGSPDMVHAYEFLGTPRWIDPDERSEPGKAPDKSEWRGYGQVRTIAGSGSDPSGYTVTTRSFLGGTGDDMTDFDGNTVSDVPLLQGHVLQEQTWTMTSLSPRAYAEVDSTRWGYTIQATGSGPPRRMPGFALTTRERSREKLGNGTWRYTDERTAYNADGLPIRVNDYGQEGVAADNTCTSTSYARNADAGQWMIDFPSVVEERAGDNCTSGTLIGKSITLYDAGTDPATNKPSDGNATEVRAYATAGTVSTSKGTYDDYGRPLTATDPLGKVTSTTYTPAVGWPATGVATTNPLGHTVTARLSHTLGEAVRVTDANGKVTEMDYDGLGRTTVLWKPGQPRGGGTPSATVAYDIPFDGWLGQPTAPVKTTISQLLTGTTYTTTHSYDDGLGRVREAQTAAPSGGRIVTATTYDPRGLTAAVSEPVHNTGDPGSGLLNPALTGLPQWTKTVYDGLERPVASIAYHQDTELRRTSTAYLGSERTEVTPPVGGKSATVTDVFGRTVKVEEWSDATQHADTTYGYDLRGNLTKMTDANGNVRTYGYDWLDRRTAATDPDAGASSYGYDLAGRQVWSIDGNNQKISNAYDDLGRRISQWAGEAGTGTKLAEWSYDTVAKGQPTAATRHTAGHAYTQTVTGYDSDYRPTGSTATIPAVEGALAGTYAFSLGYDAAGNVREQGLPAAGGLPAETVSHSYTGLGFAKAMTSDLGGYTYVKDTTFTLTGKLESRLLGADGQIKRLLERDPVTDWLSRVTTQTKADTSSPDTIQDDRYGYTVAGNISRVHDAASAIAGTTDGQSECFAYDGLLRLATAYTTTASSCTGSGDGLGIDPYNQAYTYDKVGNITSLTSNGQTAAYTYPTPGPTAARPNAVTAITHPGRTDTYAYDDAGQLAARTVDNKQATFAWNPLGQLDQATIDGQDTSMVYDAAGERLIRRDPDGTTTLYLGAMELRLSAGQVSAKRYYTASDASAIAMRETSGVTWLLAGLHGSTQLAVNDTTGTVNRERYLPFGQRRGNDDLPFTDRGFLGKTEDASTGLTYLGARYYDPAIAKFISTDPELDLRTPEWANPYSYAGNNPIDLSDPDGRRVDTGNRKSDATFAKTHHASGKKKTKGDKERERKHKQAVQAQSNKTKGSKNKKAPKIYLDCHQGLCSTEPQLSPIEIGVFLWVKRYYDIVITGATCAEKPDISCLDTLADAKFKRPHKKSKECSSFVPGTRVLMANGTAKPIEKIIVGDKVIATDPKTGKTTAKLVTARITSKGVKNLVRVTVGRGDEAGVLTATAEHPFWIPTTREWNQASTLWPGQHLWTDEGTYSQVSAITARTSGAQRVHNLTVADTHTYYVLAGTTPVLVHNDDPGNGIDMSGATPWQGRFPLGGALDAGGPKNGILYRTHNGSISNYAVYDANGVILRRVDLIGASHDGVPTPHVQEFIRNVTPDGKIYPQQSKVASPAGPDDLPRGSC